ncbi:MAG: ABC transporter ATP-binding protein [Ignavibacteriae bacterium]|nr:ABC transporter ATP-binding protein [Ignavibacteriota bacterium]
MNTYKRILTFVIPFWKHLIVTIISVILFSLLHGATVYLTIPLLDTLFQQKEITAAKIEKTQIEEKSNILPNWINEELESISKTFHKFIFAGETSDVLFRICLLILLSFLGKSIFSYIQEYFLAYVQQGIIKNIRDAAYKHLHKLPMSFFKNEKTGDLISRITNDVYIMEASLSSVFFSLFREPLTLVIFVIIAVSISWKLFVISLLILPFSILIIVWLGKRLRKQSKILQGQMGNLTTILQETLSGIKIVKAFGMEKYENEKFVSETRRFFKTFLKKARIQNIASPATEFIAVSVGVVIIYYGGLLVLEQKSLRASEFLTFLFAVFQMIPILKTIATVNNKIQESIAAGDRIFEIIDTEPKIKNVENPIEINGFSENIEFQNVTFKYDDSDEIILDNISLKVNKGEIIALVGGSGAGKTTFVDLIPRFYDPTSGRIFIDGNDTKLISLESLRKLMGIVTQETVLFNESIKKNIAYGLKDFPVEKIIEVAKIANAHNFIEDMPNKYETVIGEHGTKISGGQRQRLSIARALLKNPPIMIFDEATSALDNESEMLVQEAIERLMAERTTFVIAHRLSTIRNASRILVLDKGKIVQQGKHQELLNDENGLYKKLYELQFRNLE